MHKLSELVTQEHNATSSDIQVIYQVIGINKNNEPGPAPSLVICVYVYLQRSGMLAGLRGRQQQQCRRDALCCPVCLSEGTDRRASQARPPSQPAYQHGRIGTGRAGETCGDRSQELAQRSVGRQETRTYSG